MITSGRVAMAANSMAGHCRKTCTSSVSIVIWHRPLLSKACGFSAVLSCLAVMLGPGWSPMERIRPSPIAVLTAGVHSWACAHLFQGQSQAQGLRMQTRLGPVPC
jgi:hypothetical protein